MYVLPAVFEAVVLEEELKLGNIGVGKVGLETGGWRVTRGAVGTGRWGTD